MFTLSSFSEYEKGFVAGVAWSVIVVIALLTAAYAGRLKRLGSMTSLTEDGGDDLGSNSPVADA